MHRLFVTLLLAGCAGAAPPGFPRGDHWSIPLVGPLEDGALVVPVMIDGTGPYLFYLDPDAPVSALDSQLVDDLRLDLTAGPRLRDQPASKRRREYAIVPELALGDLVIRDHTLLSQGGTDFFNLDGRRVRGMIGRDVIEDRLVLGVDRVQGIVTLAVATAFAPPPGAAAIHYTRTDADPLTDARAVPRRVADARVGAAALRVHLDLGAPVSQLRPEAMARAGLAPAPLAPPSRLVDEGLFARTVDRGARADVTAGARTARVTFVPYVDERFAKLDGALGLDFFRGAAVYASWRTATLYVQPRGDAAATLTARLGRWGAALAGCPHPGCAEVKVTRTDSVPRLDVTRDPQARGKPLELLLGPAPSAGAAPDLVVELPAGTDAFVGGVPAEYGSGLSVIDASVFTRPCAGNAGCVYPAPAH